MTEVHVCLFPELVPVRDRGNVSGPLRIEVYDQEDDPEVGERTCLASLEKWNRDPGWTLIFHETRPNGLFMADRWIGVYPYVEPALRDLAYILGQYWSPTRS